MPAYEPPDPPGKERDYELIRELQDQLRWALRKAAVWQDYVSFVRSVEVTPMHFTKKTIKGTPAELVTLNRLHHGTMGLVGEASEVSELVKKCLYGKRKPFNQEVRDRLLDELGDVFFYLTLDLDALGLTLEDIMNYNKAKLTDRYPELLETPRVIGL